MSITTFLAENRIVIEAIYALLVIIPALITYQKTWQVYKFSKKRSVKWFSLAFLGFALAFLVRFFAMLYLMKTGADPLATVSQVIIPFFLMEFAAGLPGFLLVYSLTRKQKTTIRPAHLFILAAIIAIGDILLQSFTLLYASQIIIYTIGAWTAWQRTSQKKSNTRKAMAWTMTIILFVWVANAVGQYTIDDSPALRIPVYLFTIGGMWSFLAITERLLKR